MEELELLKKRVTSLVSFIRVLFSSILVMIGIDCLYELSRVEKSLEIFAGFGEELPKVTTFVLNYWETLSGVVVLVVVSPIILSYVMHRRIWPISTILFTSIGLYFFSKMVAFALLSPIIQLMKNLSG